MVATIHSATLIGLEAKLIDVEVEITHVGLPYIKIVGLPDKAVQESKERVRSALRSTGITLRARKTTINLAPASLPKQGPAFDLPIALALLQTYERIPKLQEKTLIIGELSLNGKVKYVPGSLACVLLAKTLGYSSIMLPEACKDEVKRIEDIDIFLVETLQQTIDHITRHQQIPPLSSFPTSQEIPSQQRTPYFPFPHIQGQEAAKRATLIAAAGGHHMFLYGSPGIGKTLLAQYLWHLLPPPTEEERLELITIQSVSGVQTHHRPFRTPHHSIKLQALLGNNNSLQPGEITLAHCGILFLDEFGEFGRSVLESLRKPLDDGALSLIYAKQEIHYPAHFQLVAAMNLCPCGYFQTRQKRCTCTAPEIRRYAKKLSGPLADRIDMHITLEEVWNEIDNNALSSTAQNLTLKTLKQQVNTARARQRQRYYKNSAMLNVHLNSASTVQYCHVASKAKHLLESASHTLKFSGRRYYNIIRVAQTIADLAHHEEIEKEDMGEAIQLCRPL